MGLTSEICHTDLIRFLAEQGADFVTHAVLWAPDATEQYLEEHEDKLDQWLEQEGNDDIIRN